MKAIHILLFLFFAINSSMKGQVCLVAQYDFNGNGNDTTGNGHNGTVTGPTLIPDRFNRPNHAYSFDGVNDQINVPDHPELEGFQKLTISFWMNMPEYDYNGSAKSILQKWGSGPLPDRCYLFGYDSLKNYFIFQIFLNGANSGFLVDIPLNVLPKHQWHMITGVYDGDSMHLYFDSLKVKSTNVPNGDSINKGIADLTIGKEQGVNDYVRIKLDDIKIFKCALTHLQVDSLFHFDPFACNLDTTLSVSGDSLWSNEMSAHYEWITCSGGSLMPGDTMPYYVATSNGSYKVIVEKGSCTDTSECVTLSNVGVNEISEYDFNIYPNPASTELWIDFQKNIQNITVELYNSIGVQVFKGDHWTSSQIHIPLSAPAGMYFLKITLESEFTVIRQVCLK